MSALYEYNKTRIFYHSETGEWCCCNCWKSLGKEYQISNYFIPDVEIVITS